MHYEFRYKYYTLYIIIICNYLPMFYLDIYIYNNYNTIYNFVSPKKLKYYTNVYRY